MHQHIELRRNGIHFPDNIFQCIFLNENVWILNTIWLKFVPEVQLTMIQHWFRKWLGAYQATSHYLNQWWSGLVILGLNKLTLCGVVAIWRHWLSACIGSKWLVDWQHQAIVWTNVDLPISSVRSSDSLLKEISQNTPQPLITQIILETILNFKWNLLHWVDQWIRRLHHEGEWNHSPIYQYRSAWEQLCVTKVEPTTVYSVSGHGGAAVLLPSKTR